GHDIPLHVSARTECGQEAGVDAGDCLLQLPLKNAMQLDPLSCREAERPVGVGTRQLIDGQILLGGQLATRYPATDHEYVLLAAPFSSPVFSSIPIILLVAAVKLEELLILIRKMSRLPTQLLRDRPAKLPARFLDSFDCGELRGHHARVVSGPLKSTAH